MRWLIYLALAAAAVLVAGRAYRRWWERQPDLALDIKPPKYRAEWKRADEQLQLRTQKRREVAAAIRARAAKVESGATAGDVLRMVK